MSGIADLQSKSGGGDCADDTETKTLKDVNHNKVAVEDPIEAKEKDSQVKPRRGYKTENNEARPVFELVTDQGDEGKGDSNEDVSDTEKGETECSPRTPGLDIPHLMISATTDKEKRVSNSPEGGQSSDDFSEVRTGTPIKLEKDLLFSNKKLACPPSVESTKRRRSITVLSPLGETGNTALQSDQNNDPKLESWLHRNLDVKSNARREKLGAIDIPRRHSYTNVTCVEDLSASPNNLLRREKLDTLDIPRRGSLTNLSSLSHEDLSVLPGDKTLMLLNPSSTDSPVLQRRNTLDTIELKPKKSRKRMNGIKDSIDDPVVPSDSSPAMQKLSTSHGGRYVRRRAGHLPPLRESSSLLGTDEENGRRPSLDKNFKL